MSERRWWLCPNRECDHGNILHDVEDLDDPTPTCTVGGCPCGHRCERCQDCGNKYLTVYWLPDDVWVAITPKPGKPEGGLLCPGCAERRARGAGIVLSWTAERL